MKTFSEFVKTYGELRRDSAHPSRGDAAFLALAEVHPTAAREIIHTDADPYHHDERLPRFYEAMKNRWEPER